MYTKKYSWVNLHWYTIKVMFFLLYRIYMPLPVSFSLSSVKKNGHAWMQPSFWQPEKAFKLDVTDFISVNYAYVSILLLFWIRWMMFRCFFGFSCCWLPSCFTCVINVHWSAEYLAEDRTNTVLVPK